MQLGNGVALKYILRAPANDAVNSIDIGTVERDGRGGLRVRNEHGTLIQELSGTRIRSWCIVGPDYVSIDGDVIPGDYERFRLGDAQARWVLRDYRSGMRYKACGTSRPRKSGAPPHA